MLPTSFSDDRIVALQKEVAIAAAIEWAGVRGPDTVVLNGSCAAHMYLPDHFRFPKPRDVDFLAYVQGGPASMDALILDFCKFVNERGRQLCALAGIGSFVVFQAAVTVHSGKPTYHFVYGTLVRHSPFADVTFQSHQCREAIEAVFPRCRIRVRGRDVAVASLSEVRHRYQLAVTGGVSVDGFVCDQRRAHAKHLCRLRQLQDVTGNWVLAPRPNPNGVFYDGDGNEDADGEASSSSLSSKPASLSSSTSSLSLSSSLSSSSTSSLSSSSISTSTSTSSSTSSSSPSHLDASGLPALFSKFEASMITSFQAVHKKLDGMSPRIAAAASKVHYIRGVVKAADLVTRRHVQALVDKVAAADKKVEVTIRDSKQVCDNLNAGIQRIAGEAEEVISDVLGVVAHSKSVVDALYCNILRMQELVLLAGELLVSEINYTKSGSGDMLNVDVVPLVRKAVIHQMKRCASIELEPYGSMIPVPDSLDHWETTADSYDSLLASLFTGHLETVFEKKALGVVTDEFVHQSCMTILTVATAPIAKLVQHIIQSHKLFINQYCAITTLVKRIMVPALEVENGVLGTRVGKCREKLRRIRDVPFRDFEALCLDSGSGSGSSGTSGTGLGSGSGSGSGTGSKSARRKKKHK